MPALIWYKKVHIDQQVQVVLSHLFFISGNSVCLSYIIDTFYKACPIRKCNELSLLNFVLAVILKKASIETWFNVDNKLGYRHKAYIL